MTEIIVQRQKENTIIVLIKNGKLVEYYEDNSQHNNRKEGNIYIGIVKDIVKGMQAAFIDIGGDKNSFIHLKDVMKKIDETKEKLDNNIDITKILQPNMKILVQVKKDSTEQKGARVSTHINLPGKYIALMPNTDIITVSQKIENKEEQQRLIKLVKENLRKGNGAVIRTSAQGKEEVVIKDIKKVEAKWESIIKTSVDPDLHEPKLLYESESLIEKMLLDLADEKIDKIIVNTQKDLNKLGEYKKENKEYQDTEIELDKSNNIFEKYDLEKQIEKMQNRKIWLKCGGFITIDKTEALTAIDVNTGKYTGTKNLEQTIYKVNEEATIEIAKQLRLRDIGGIVIIDYIDMKDEGNREKIENLLKEEIKKDRSKVQVEGFTKLDLMELTRKHIISH